VDVFDLETTDAVLVPVDEWSRILRQLGNLHDAGQQLAEARERAAKAETESTFLRERLRDVRDEAQRLQAHIDATPEPEPEPLPGFGEWFVRRWLERRKTR
jgi:signal transduction protein with GAF and PtsI domain